MDLPKRTGRIATTLPNFRQPVRVGYEFLTGIRTSRQGYEQREALRQTARVSLQFDTLLTQAGLQRHLADLAESQHTPFYVIAPWRTTSLDADRLAGDTAITVAEVPFWLVAGCQLVLWDREAGVAEAADVASVSGTTVTLTAGLSNPLASGTTVYGAYLARAEEETEFQAETSRVWTGEPVYAVSPGSDPQATPSITPETFEGKEVFVTPPNWASRPRVSLLELRETADSGFGIVQTSTPTNRVQPSLRLGFTGLSTDKVEALIGLFLRQKGKRGAFWMPTWQDDLTPLATASAGATTFDVAGEDAFYAFDGSDVFNVVIARWAGGHQVNRVASVALSGGNTRITFTDAWSAAVGPSTAISWCPLWRFATDRLEVRRVTGTVAEMQFAVIGLRNEEAA